MGAYHIIPGGDDALHIKIAGKERDNAVRYDFAILNEDASKVTYNGWVVPDFETGAYCHLVTAPCNNLKTRVVVHSQRVR